MWNYLPCLNTQVKSAKEESRSPGEMEAKVAMVDNLVNLFIQGAVMNHMHVMKYDGWSAVTNCSNLFRECCSSSENSVFTEEKAN